jgi:hypothetical protein
MTFPVVQTTATFSDSSNTGSHAVSLPTGITAGDLLMIFADCAGSPSPGTFTATGWTFFATEANGTNGFLTVGYRQPATGSEGASVTVTTTGSTRLGWASYRISGSDTTTAPSKPTGTTGTSANPGPPANTPAWGALDTLWIAAYGAAGSSGSASAAPSGFSGLLNSAGALSSGASAWLQSHTATETPGTFTTSGSGGWVATTVAIKPAAGVLSTGWLLGRDDPPRPLKSYDQAAPVGPKALTIPIANPIQTWPREDVYWAKPTFSDHPRQGIALQIPTAPELRVWPREDVYWYKPTFSERSRQGIALTIPIANPIVPQTREDVYWAKPTFTIAPAYPPSFPPSVPLTTPIQEFMREDVYWYKARFTDPGITGAPAIQPAPFLAPWVPPPREDAYYYKAVYSEPVKYGLALTIPIANPIQVWPREDVYYAKVVFTTPAAGPIIQLAALPVSPNFGILLRSDVYNATAPSYTLAEASPGRWLLTPPPLTTPIQNFLREDIYALTFAHPIIFTTPPATGFALSIPPSFIAAMYRLLAPHYLTTGMFPPNWIVTEGLEIPIGWIPTLDVDPLNARAVNAFYNAGPRNTAWEDLNRYTGMYNPGYPGIDIPVNTPTTFWKQVSGTSTFQLQGLGIGLPPIGV